MRRTGEDFRVKGEGGGLQVAGCRLRVAGEVFLLCFFLSVLQARALLPEQCALLINQNDPDSKAIANHYAKWRGIPVENLFYLDVPNEALGTRSTLTADVFEKAVLQPMRQELRFRKLTERVLVWIYSSGFPTRIQAARPVSLQGFTLNQGSLPETSAVRDGRAVSPFFAGVDGQPADAPMRPSIPFRAWQLGTGKTLPTPSMMLSHLGTRGLTKDEALAHLETGMQSDGLRPPATVLLHDGENVRARCRAFQFDPVRAALDSSPMKVKIVKTLPKNKSRLMGVLAGKAVVVPRQLGTFAPGAYADHLTSFGALFSQRHQTKCTEWLRSGAVATSGTVVEPRAIWTKFPSARFFVHYQAGMSMIESLYAATASPFEILFLGDPLCSPYHRQIPLVLIDLSSGPYTGSASFQAHPADGRSPESLVWQFFLDGTSLGPPSPDARLTVDTPSFADGYHRLEVAAIHREDALIQGRASLDVVFRNRQRSIRGTAPGGPIPLRRPVSFSLTADPDAVEVGLRVQGKLLARASGHQATVEVRPDMWGEGPCQWQACAKYADGREVCSEPRWLEVQDLNRPPEIGTIQRLGPESEHHFAVDVKDPEQDPASVSWWVGLAGDPGPITDWGRHLDIEPEGTSDRKDAWRAGQVPESPSASGLSAVFERAGSARDLIRGGRFGLMIRDSENDDFYVFGFSGGQGSWSLELVQNGQWKEVWSLGRPIFKGTEYQLTATESPSGSMVFSINGVEVLKHTPKIPVARRRTGVLAHPQFNLSEVELRRATGRTWKSDAPVPPDMVVEASDALGAVSRREFQPSRRSP